MSTANFFRERAQAFADNTVAALLLIGGSAVTGWIANHFALAWGFSPRTALVVAWALALLVAVALSLLLKPKQKPQEAQPVSPPAQQTLTQSGINNAPHNEFNPHNKNVFNPTVIVNTSASQPQSPKRESEEVSAARRVLAKQPELEYKGSRFIRRPIDLSDNTLGDRDYGDSELAHGFRNVGVALAKFYYRPDVGVDPWLSVRAHIEFRDAYGEATTINDAMWHKEDDKYKQFNTGDSHYLIVALIPIGSKDKVLTYEHNLEAHDPVFTKTHGLTAEHLAPEIRDINGKEFNFRVELIGKRFDQVIVKKGFNLKLTLDPEYKLEEIKPTSILTDVATPSESQAKRDYKIERLKEFIRDLESNQFVSLDREVRSRRLMLAWQVEEFLKEYFDEAHAKRYTKEGVSVLKKTLKDLLE